jgi:MFS transporter, DHA2 family, multidrug resistance protein
VLLERFWWGSVFLVAVPVMALLLVLGPFLLPEFRDPRAGRLDLLSAGMSLVAVLAVIYGLTQTAEQGPAWAPAASIIAGLAIAAAFVRRQRRIADPLIDLGLFRGAPFDVAVATNMVAILTADGVFLFIAQYLQLVRGLSPLRAGLWTLPWAGALVAGACARRRRWSWRCRWKPRGYSPWLGGEPVRARSRSRSCP